MHALIWLIIFLLILIWFIIGVKICYSPVKKGRVDDIGEVPAADVQPIDRWISVDERLPKTGESVLVYVAINKNLKGFGECKPEIRIGWLDDGGKWALQFSNMDYSEVLCWLPIPELPKDGDK